ncbi:unnamed protein product, partial [Arabidopsis halleri]
KALVTIVGEGAADKARALSGCDVKGWDITVVGVTHLGAKRNRSSSSCRSLPMKSKALDEEKTRE